MKKEKEAGVKNVKPETEEGKIKRRTLLKAMTGIPVLGVFGYELFKELSFQKGKDKQIMQKLGLGDLKSPVLIKKSSGRDLLRIGIIGFGTRAVVHANALGYMHPEDVLNRKKNGTLQDWLLQDDLNVAITGICDVYDRHAQRAIETIENEVHPNGFHNTKLPLKRYLHWQEMLEDKNIDAVMIATPDHHHAEISIAAAQKGKHIYCEKSVALNEQELNKLYNVVKESNIVYQLGHQITKSAVFQQAKEIIQRNILGKITLVETTTNRNTASGAWIRHLDANGNLKPGCEKDIDWKQWLGNTPYVPFSADRYYNWTKWFAYDTGMIGQLFTHEFDAVNQLLEIGIPHSVMSSGGIYYWKDNREIPDLLQCVFEYPNKDLTLLYSGCLANSRSRGRIFMGRDASMELGNSVQITVDNDSERYKKMIESGEVDPSKPMLSLVDGTQNVDAVTSATARYFASRGLVTTNINGHEIDLTYLHIKEWIDCIRYGGEPAANIERAYEEGVACLMANQSYLEKRRVEWDPVKRKIV